MITRRVVLAVRQAGAVWRAASAAQCQLASVVAPASTGAAVVPPPPHAATWLPSPTKVLPVQRRWCTASSDSGSGSGSDTLDEVAAQCLAMGKLAETRM